MTTPDEQWEKHVKGRVGHPKQWGMSEETKTYVDGRFELTDLKLNHIAEAVGRIEKSISEMSCKRDAEYKDFDERLTELENWRIKFVAKFSVYTAIALFIGTLVSNFGLDLIGK